MDQVIIQRDPCGCPSDTVHITQISDLCKTHQEEANSLMLIKQPEFVGDKTLIIPEEVGVKFDSGKAKLSMVPRPALEAIAEVFAYGANKYGKNNYKKGMQYSRLIDAALRHLIAFTDKEDTDPESGLSHLAHCATNLCMLIEYTKKNIGEDDR